VGFRHRTAVLAVLAAGILTACSPAVAPAPPVPPAPAAVTSLPSSPAPASERVSETGSTLLYPLFRLWAPAYMAQFPQVKITTAGTGSGAGITSAATGKADIGASDAYLSSADVAAHPSLENIPLAVSAQQVSYNLPRVAGNLKLNGTVLAQMYQGEITTWNNPAIRALNPGVTLPDITVVPLHRSDSSGDTFLFTSYLTRQDPTWASAVGYNTTVAWPRVPAALAAKGNSGMVAACKASVGCIAYIGISYKSETRAAGLGEAALANSVGGYELPTPGSIAAAAASFPLIPENGAISLINAVAPGAYPIINYEYAIVNSRQPDATMARDIKALLYWAITVGGSGKYLSQVNFEPLPAVAQAVSRTLIAEIGS
jgi:phosphate transport system substrate-binding protein